MNMLFDAKLLKRCAFGDNVDTAAHLGVKSSN